MTGDHDMPFQRLCGERLSAVTFVLDYWQLAFDGPLLTVISRLTVKDADGEVSNGQSGFRDRLCECIGHVVAVARLQPGLSLVVTFADGRSVEVSLRDQDRCGPEALHFHPDGVGRTICVL